MGAHERRSGGSSGGRHARSCGAGAVRALGGRCRRAGGRLAGAAGAEGPWPRKAVGAVAGGSGGGGADGMDM